MAQFNFSLQDVLDGFQRVRLAIAEPRNEFRSRGVLAKVVGIGLAGAPQRVELGPPLRDQAVLVGIRLAGCLWFCCVCHGYLESCLRPFTM